MKYYIRLVAATALSAVAYGFPTNGLHLEELTKRANGGSISGTFVPDPAQIAGIFNAKAQYVSNQGQYAFKAPGPNDARGPCPGLNAMANHGYIPHNGVGTIEQFVQGCYNVFGMGLDLGAFLAIYGALIEGDGKQWSIGGPVAGYFGNGLIGSHDNYEADVSPTRPDLYQYGNDYQVITSQWEDLYSYQAHLPNDQSNYNLAVLQEFRSKRFDQQIANNPYFFNGPFSGVAVQPAAYTFIYRFMGNKSAEHPEGQLTQNVLKAFFGMTQNADGSWSGGTGKAR
jgi:Peroxidase, family 2